MSLPTEDSQPHEPQKPRGLLRSLDHLLRGRPAGNEPTAVQIHIHPRTIRRVVVGLEIVAVLLIVCAFALTITMRHAMRSALPQIDGNLAVEGLSAPVTVTRDAHGVPSIAAANLEDLLFAQGFVTAQDRLWQMDILRRHGAGELAEVLGSSLLEHDRIQRYLQVRAAADRAVTTLPPDQLHQLEAYARGVNAFIMSHSQTLPVEFHLLHYTPALWSPRDSLLVVLVMSQDLSTSFPQKLNRETLSQHLPAVLLADLYPTTSWRDHPPTQTELDLTAPTESIQQIPLDKTQARVEVPGVSPGELLKTFAALDSGPCESCRAGSNDWAVAGSRSASGAPLVSNDMHLGLSAPDIWYEASLHAAKTPTDAAFDVAGVTLPGTPFVVAGRNAYVAWGYSNTGSDVQDVRIEHLRGSGSQTEFEQLDGTGKTAWAPAGHRIERIHVLGGKDVTLDVLTTTHLVGTVPMETPVISPLHPSEQRALSLAWNVYDPANITVPFFAINSARDAASLVAAFASFGGPSENLIYADGEHIGFHVLGRVPIRGPAVQRPRATQPFILPDRTPESDEEDESKGPTAFTGDHLDHLPKAAWVQDQLPAQPTTPYTIGSPIAYVPVDALDASQAWSGYVPYNALPSVLDPDSGVVATANARVTTDDYPYFISGNWGDPYRAARIYKLLDHRTGLRSADMLAIQTDVHSEFNLQLAQRLAYALDHANTTVTHNDPRLRQAANLLRDWKGDMTPGSPAAAIAYTVHNALWLKLLAPQIERHDAKNAKPGAKRASALSVSALYTWGERTSVLEQLLMHTPARWLPPHVADWNDLLASTVADALKDNHAPADLPTWRYGAVHNVEIAHTLFGSNGPASWLLGVPTGTGAQPSGGDGTTVDAAGLHFGPSERFTADLADPEAFTLNITTGESGNPASPWFLDQFLPWLHGTTFVLPLYHPSASHTLILIPR
jgi:penicillin amidase